MPANQSTPEVTRAWEAIVKEFGAYMRDDWNGDYPEKLAMDAAVEALVSATPARGGDELREAANAISHVLNREGMPEGGWSALMMEAAQAAAPFLASTDMAGAAASEPISSHPENGAAPPVEGLTSGEGDVERLQQENAAYLSDVRWWLEIATGKGHGSITNALNAAPSAASPKATATASVRDVVVVRKAIYEAKRDAAYPFAEAAYNQYDSLKFTVEAFDYLLSEIDAASLTDSGTAATIGGERA